MEDEQQTHSVLLGYVLWIFGFIGAHRFYYGKQISGVIWFLTLGLLLIGWIIDLLLIPRMAREADRRFVPGPVNYSLTWVLLTFLGYLGLHPWQPLPRLARGDEAEASRQFVIADGTDIGPLPFPETPGRIAIGRPVVRHCPWCF